MKYTLQELHSIIQPMIESLGTRSAAELTGAIVDLIDQDRIAQANPPNITDSSILNKFYGEKFYELYRLEWNKIVALGDVNADSHIEAAKRAAGIA